MREFNALKRYPQPKEPRFVSPTFRTIHHRIIASQRGYDFYDGDRSYGYGGYINDGRWRVIAEDLCTEYGLTSSSKVLQVGCDKGFLLHELQTVCPGITVRGIDISAYPLDHCVESVKNFLELGSFTKLPGETNSFDFVIAMGAVYILNLGDAIQCLKEIQRVGKGKSFITLGAYDSEEDLRLFKAWSLLGTTVLRKDEWREVLNHCGYTGDYTFVTAEALNLHEQK